MTKKSSKKRKPKAVKLKQLVFVAGDSISNGDIIGVLYGVDTEGRLWWRNERSAWHPNGRWHLEDVPKI